MKYMSIKLRGCSLWGDGCAGRTYEQSILILACVEKVKQRTLYYDILYTI
jgi:hypothetical protein